MNEAREAFGRVLKTARKQARLSLSEMASRMGVSRAAVARCETGQPLGERVIARYAAALQLDVELRLVPRGDANAE